MNMSDLNGKFLYIAPSSNISSIFPGTLLMARTIFTLLNKASA